MSDSETGITLITRNEQYQIEENETLNLKIIFSITWISDCIYELRPAKVIKGAPLSKIKDIVITAEITKVKSHGYQAICSTNLTTDKKTLIVEIVE